MHFYVANIVKIT